MSLLTRLNHRHLCHTASTNSQIIEEVKSAQLDASLPHLLTTEQQSAGRGQHTRSWQSPPGNVYLSLYLPMSLPVTGLMSLVVGYQLAKMPVIEQLNAQRQAQQLATIGVKWANDLGFYAPQINPNLANEHPLPACRPITAIAFNKLAGILIEPIWQTNRMLGCVIGVGLNVATTPILNAQTLEGMSYQALSLKDICPSSPLPSLYELYEQIAQALLDAHHVFANLSQQTHDIDSFLSAFAQVDALVGKRLRVTRQIQHSEEVLTGVASGIDRQGCLQLRLDDATLMSLFTGRIDVVDEPLFR